MNAELVSEFNGTKGDQFYFNQKTKSLYLNKKGMMPVNMCVICKINDIFILQSRGS